MPHDHAPAPLRLAVNADDLDDAMRDPDVSRVLNDSAAQVTRSRAEDRRVELPARPAAGR